MKRKGWTRLGKGLFSLWKHDASGWFVKHCGHPTAPCPWFILSPEGQLILNPNGRAWRLLADAFDHVEQLLAGVKGSHRSAPSA